MPPSERRSIDFDEVDELTAAMATVRSIGDGGWINLRPNIDADTDVPPDLGRLAVFSKRGPAIPVVTWTPAPSTKHRTPTQVGVQHAVASAIKKRLAATDAAIPTGWRVVTDHPKRGMVVQIPDSVDDWTLATWMLRLLDTVCAIPHTGRVDLDLFTP